MATKRETRRFLRRSLVRAGHTALPILTGSALALLAWFLFFRNQRAAIDATGLPFWGVFLETLEHTAPALACAAAVVAALAARGSARSWALGVLAALIATVGPLLYVHAAGDTAGAQELAWDAFRDRHGFLLVPITALASARAVQSGARLEVRLAAALAPWALGGCIAVMDDLWWELIAYPATLCCGDGPPFVVLAEGTRGWRCAGGAASTLLLGWMAASGRRPTERLVATGAGAFVASRVAIDLVTLPLLAALRAHHWSVVTDPSVEPLARLAGALDVVGLAAAAALLATAVALAVGRRRALPRGLVALSTIVILVGGRPSERVDYVPDLRETDSPALPHFELASGSGAYELVTPSCGPTHVVSGGEIHSFRSTACERGVYSGRIVVLPDAQATLGDLRQIVFWESGADTVEIVMRRPGGERIAAARARWGLVATEAALLASHDVVVVDAERTPTLGAGTSDDVRLVDLVAEGGRPSIARIPVATDRVVVEDGSPPRFGPGWPDDVSGVQAPPWILAVAILAGFGLAVAGLSRSLRRVQTIPARGVATGAQTEPAWLDPRDASLAIVVPDEGAYRASLTTTRTTSVSRLAWRVVFGSLRWALLDAGRAVVTLGWALVVLAPFALWIGAHLFLR